MFNWDALQERRKSERQRVVCRYIVHAVFAAVLAAVIVASQAHAAPPTNTWYVFRGDAACSHLGDGGSYCSGATPTAALQAYVAAGASCGYTNYGTTTGVNNGDPSPDHPGQYISVIQGVKADRTTPCSFLANGLTEQAGYRCATGGYWNGSGCTYPATCPAAGTPHEAFNTGVTGEGSVVPNTVCDGGCTYTVIKNPGVVLGTGSGAVWAASWGNSTGADCSGTTAGLESTSCAAGTCPGTVNGSEVCVPCNQLPNKTSSTSDTSDSTSTDTTDGSGTPTGSQTTTKDTSTTCDAAGNCVQTTTTTTTDYDASGDPTGTTTTTATLQLPQDAFCTQNPSASICKLSSFSGACPDAFVCDGDGLQCAIAKEVHTRNCQFFEGTHATRTLGEAMLAGTDSGALDNPAASGNRDSINLEGFLDQTPVWSAECPADFTTTLAGAEIAVPFSLLCTPMQFVGLLAVSLALVLGFRIAVGG